MYVKDNLTGQDEQFIDELKLKFPNLTNAEVEICSLIRLSMSNKEIASFRGTSDGAVKVAKHRIKKKLNC